MGPLFEEIFIVNDMNADRARARGAREGRPTIVWNGDPVFGPMVAIAAGAAGRAVMQEGLMERLEAGERERYEALGGVDAGWARALAADGEKGMMNEGGAGKGAERVLFCPSNDTHVRTFAPIARRMRGAEFLHFHRGGAAGENTEAALEEAGVEYRRGGAEALGALKPGAIVLANDWNEDSVRLLRACWGLRIPVACLQEGCLDFGTRVRRMETCDWPLVQGAIVPRYLPHRAYFLTGNPRQSELRAEPVPATARVMINCNFTYGVFEEAREGWVRDAARACREAGVEFFVSQHPRDTGAFGDLPVRRSGPGLVEKHLRECSLVISRFSTVIYEAMLMGRKCVYYNPHGEGMELFQRDAVGGLPVARNAAELERRVAEALAGRAEGEEHGDTAGRRRFLELHCGPGDGREAERCASALASLARAGRRASQTYWKRRLRNLGAQTGTQWREGRGEVARRAE